MGLTVYTVVQLVEGGANPFLEVYTSVEAARAAVMEECAIQDIEEGEWSQFSEFTLIYTIPGDCSFMISTATLA